MSFREIAGDALAWSDKNKRSAGDDHIRMGKLLNWFGEKPADSILPGEIERRFESETWSRATWNRYRALLSLTYRLAIRNGKAKRNPAPDLPHKTEHNEGERYLTIEEEKKLRVVILKKFSERLPEFELALHTGMRLSEQYNGRWEDVDFEHRTIRVVVYKGKRPRTTYVQLNDSALSALARLRESTWETGYICGGIRGSRHWFEEAVRVAGIPKLTWHCLRHTFASRLTMAGTDPRTVAELLRDRTLHMAMRYSHLAPDFTLNAVRQMEAKFQIPTDTTVALSALTGSARVN